ncbi:hypothetical protein ACSQ91_22895, partial [Salmonella enterica]
ARPAPSALETLPPHYDAGPLAVIAAKLSCPPDVHAIKEALALAGAGVQGGVERRAMGGGDTWLLDTWRRPRESQ